MPISDFEGDTTAFRNTFYRVLRSSFIDDSGDSTFATDDASTDSAPNVSVFQAILWAIASAMGQAQEQLERAGANRNPATANELLALLEQDYQSIPPYGSSIAQRQAALALRARVVRGASRPAIEAALTEMLGADFVAYETISDVADIQTWPPSPGDVGVFETPTAERKIFTIIDSISLTNVPRTVRFEVVGDSNQPIVGEVYCVDPDPRSRTEKVTILGVADGSLTAVFTQAHEPNTLACRPHPVWISSQRFNRVVLSLTAAKDQGIRAKVNDYLKRTLRATSQWCIVSDQGAFLLGSATRGLLGVTSFSASGASAALPNSRPATLAVTATSSLHAVGSSTNAGMAAGAISGTCVVAAVGAGRKLAAATIAGSGALTATSSSNKTGVGAIAGTGLVQGFGIRGPFAAIVGTGTVTATSNAQARSPAAIVGTGAVAAVGATQARAAASITGNSSVHAVKG